MVLISTLLGWFFLQSYVRVPDGYQIDVDRDPPRYAAPVDRDNIVSLEVPSGRFLAGGGLSFRYDEEDRKLGRDADTLTVRVQWRF